MGVTVQESIKQMEELLALLFKTSSDSDVVTRKDIIRRYPDTLIRREVVEAIERGRRIVRAVGDYDSMGLSEFHAGLIFLDSKQHRGAVRLFAEAGKLWSFSSCSAAVCLTHFAVARSLRHAQDYENALIACGRGLRELARLSHLAIRSDQAAFVDKLQEMLTAEQAYLRSKLYWMDEAPASDHGAVPPPHVGGSRSGSSGTADASEPFWQEPDSQQTSYEMPPGIRSPIPGHTKTAGELHWYQVVERAPDQFEREIPIKAYVLAFKPEDRAQIRPDSHVITRLDGWHASIRLERFGGPAVGARIYLGRFMPLGDFMRDEKGKVHFSDQYEEYLDDIFPGILGVVIGFWHDIWTEKRM